MKRVGEGKYQVCMIDKGKVVKDLVVIDRWDEGERVQDIFDHIDASYMQETSEATRFYKVEDPIQDVEVV